MARKPGLTGLQDAQQLSAFGLVRHPRKSLGQSGFRVQLSGGSVAHTQAQGVLTLGAPFLVGSSTTRTPYSAAILTIPGGAVNFSGASVTRTRTPSAVFTPGTVGGGGTGMATLAWAHSTDALKSGYRVYYGSASGVYQQPFGSGIDVGNVTTYVSPALTAGTWFFAVTTVASTGDESAYSNEVSKVIA